jgi:O-antigen/teichoic acid export membrane protein
MSQRRIALGSIASLGLTATTVLVSVIQLRLVVRELTPTLAGLWILLMALGQYVAVMDLGFGPTLSREIAFALGRSQASADSRSQISSLIASIQRVLTSIAVALFIFGLPLGGVIIWRQSPTSELMQTWVIFLLGATTNLTGNVGVTALYGFGHVATERMIRAFSQLLWLAMTFAALKMGFGIRGLAVAWLIQGLLMRLSAYVFLHRHHSWLRSTKGHVSFSLLKTLLPPSLKWAATSLGALLILQSGSFIIGLRLTAAEIPRYEALSKVAAALMTLGLTLVTASTPFLSQLVAANDQSGAKKLIFTNVKICVSATALGAIFFGFFGEDIVRLWLGEGLFAGQATLIALLVMACLEVHHVVLASATMAAGHVPFAGAAVFAGALNLAMGLVLAKFYGVFGVAFAILIAQLVTNNWYAPWYTFRVYSISIRDYLGAVIAPITLLLGCLTATAFALQALSIGPRTPIVILSLAAIYGTVSLSLGLFLLITRSERSKILTLIKRKAVV